MGVGLKKIDFIFTFNWKYKMNCDELREVLDFLEEEEELEEFIAFLKKEVPPDVIWYHFYYHPFPKAFFGISALVS